MADKKINKKEVLNKMMNNEPELAEERIMKLFKEYLGHYPSPDMFENIKDKKE